MKKIVMLLTVLLVYVVSVYAQPKLNEDSLNGYSANMVTIIPAGNKVEKENFAGTVCNKFSQRWTCRRMGF